MKSIRVRPAEKMPKQKFFIAAKIVFFCNKLSCVMVFSVNCFSFPKLIQDFHENDTPIEDK